MLGFDFTNQFKKDLKLLKKRGKKLDKLFDIMADLIWGDPLPARCREHKLHGDWEGFTECHVEGDWVIIYTTDGEKISFSCTTITKSIHPSPS